MQVISKRTFLFVDPSTVENKNNQVVIKSARQHTVPRTESPVDVPDWLLELPAFKEALKHKEIRKVQVIVEIDDEPEETEAEEAADDKKEVKGKKKAAA